LVCSEIEGESEQTNGAIYTFQKYKLHFVARFSRPFDSMGGWVETNITPDAQETREVMEHSYFARPAGYTGDEDEGQMGSFFALMAMGLFEMDGGCSTKPIYEIGSPLFSRIAVHLDKSYYPGRQFVIEAKNNSPENVYTQSATLNGKPLDKPWIFHSDVVKGAMLVLTMGPEPNTKWGSAPEAAPPQN
jgi:putative alpha-1,2-mannosidase